MSTESASNHAFVAVTRHSLRDTVSAQLRTAILRGIYQPGQLLPPERELAAQFGVDRHTLRAALLELELLGLVERRHGAGCRVLDYHQTGSLELLPHLLYLSGTVDLSLAASVLETGSTMIRTFLALAIEHATDDDIAFMRETLEGLDTHCANGNVAGILESHRMFVRSLCRSGHSIATELLFNSYVKAFDATLDPNHELQVRWAGEVVESVNVRAHRQLVDAIQARDVDAAQVALDVNLAQLGNFLINAIAAGSDVDSVEGQPQP